MNQMSQMNMINQMINYNSNGNSNYNSDFSADDMRHPHNVNKGNMHMNYNNKKINKSTMKELMNINVSSF